MIAMVVGIFTLMCSGCCLLIFSPFPLLLPLLGISLVLFLLRTTWLSLLFSYVFQVLCLYTHLIHYPWLEKHHLIFTLVRDTQHYGHLSEHNGVLMYIVPWFFLVNSNLVQYLLQTDIQKRTEKIQWKIQTLHRDFSPGNPNRENQHILYWYTYATLFTIQYTYRSQRHPKP